MREEARESKQKSSTKLEMPISTQYGCSTGHAGLDAERMALFLQCTLEGL